jgi:hypothetical protein
LLFDLTLQSHRLCCIVEQFPPFWRELDLPSGAIKEQYTQILFQFLDARRDGGLGKVQSLCRLDETSMASNGQKSFKLLQIHAARPR